jgi:hypothetical protein
MAADRLPCHASLMFVRTMFADHIGNVYIARHGAVACSERCIAVQVCGQHPSAIKSGGGKQASGNCHDMSS